MPRKKKAAKKRNIKKKETEHPCHGIQLPKINKVTGQLDGIKKMVENKRYCPEIIAQLRSARAGLVAIEASILETHITECVSEAIRSHNSTVAKKKIKEVITLFKNAKNKGVGI